MNKQPFPSQEIFSPDTILSLCLDICLSDGLITEETHARAVDYLDEMLELASHSNIIRPVFPQASKIKTK